MGQQQPLQLLLEFIEAKVLSYQIE